VAVDFLAPGTHPWPAADDDGLQLLGEPGEQVEPLEPRHGEVEDDGVGPQTRDFGEYPATVPDVAHNLGISAVLEQPTQQVPVVDVVLDQEHPAGAGPRGAPPGNAGAARAGDLLARSQVGTHGDHRPISEQVVVAAASTPPRGVGGAGAVRQVERGDVEDLEVTPSISIESGDMFSALHGA
jgi:hypothetical protein